MLCPYGTVMDTSNYLVTIRTWRIINPIHWVCVVLVWTCFIHGTNICSNGMHYNWKANNACGIIDTVLVMKMLVDNVGNAWIMLYSYAVSVCARVRMRGGLAVIMWRFLSLAQPIPGMILGSYTKLCVLLLALYIFILKNMILLFIYLSNINTTTSLFIFVCRATLKRIHCMATHNWSLLPTWELNIHHG